MGGRIQSQVSLNAMNYICGQCKYAENNWERWFVNRRNRISKGMDEIRLANVIKSHVRTWKMSDANFAVRLWCHEYHRCSRNAGYLCQRRMRGQWTPSMRVVAPCECHIHLEIGAYINTFTYVRACRQSRAATDGRVSMWFSGQWSCSIT